MAHRAQARRNAVVKHLVDALRAYDPERVYLFGSWARGEADALSDLDIVVIKRTSAPFFDRIRDVLRLLPDDVGAVDVLVYTPEEWEAMRARGNALAEAVEEEGVLIYERQASRRG